ncbi:uncharacterized protein [Panulirus ornatus]|uniref:uncharacterized protein isoform X3 n=1 Tax=Panulirus ornatus TaxID=150431 RepID=UPI003A855177
MFKKLRDKITEEVQHTSLRLPVSVQQSVHQLTQTSDTDQWLETIREGNQLTLSPFSGTAASPGEQKRELETGPLQDELLVDISDIRPAGHNKDLFSIDEDSHESSPSKSGFQLVDLSDAETFSSADPGNGLLQGQGVAGVTFDPTITVTSSPTHRARRDSTGSCVSDASSLFPIYEVPGVSFNMPQSDLESSSEWEDGGSTAVMERLSKDTVYQAYLKMRQRYHKYKGRYADLARAYKDKDRESEKLRDVLTKTQDKALRKVSELKEQCALEQQAKAHLEQELRSDLEERDHKIAALQTKVSGLREQCVLQQQAKAHLEEELNADLEERELKISALMTKVKILQEGVTGDLNSTVTSQNNDQSGGTQQDDRLIKNQDEADSVSASDNSSGMDNVSTTESVSLADNISMADSVSVASHGSASTAVTVNVEAEELIEKLKGDVAKHKSLLARCMDNIRGNKERIAVLTQERDVATAQLQDKIKQIETLKEEHCKELDSLRSSMESSAISMAETKKQLFEELQAKEAETERCKLATATLERKLEEEREQWQEELQIKQQELEEKEATIEELGTNVAAKEDLEEDHESSVAAMKEEVEAKIHELESRTFELKESRTQLETQLAEIDQMKMHLEEKVQHLMKDKDELKKKVEVMEDDKQEMEKKFVTLEGVNQELEVKMADRKNASDEYEEQVKELTESKQVLEEKLHEAEKSLEDLQKQVEQVQLLHAHSLDSAKVASQEIMALKKANEELTQITDDLRISLEKSEKENEEVLKKLNEKDSTLIELQEINGNLDFRIRTITEENSKANDKVESISRENESLWKQLDETKTEMEKERNSLNEEFKCVKSEKENIFKELQEIKLVKEDINQRLLNLEKENDRLKSENGKLESELTNSKENMTQANQQAFAELTLVKEKMDKLNSDWAKQMKEKDVINEGLSEKVSYLDENLRSKSDEYKQKTDEYKQQMETMNFKLQEKEKREKEYAIVVESLEEEKNKLNENVIDLTRGMQDKDIEYQSSLKNLKKENDELRVRLSELETDVNNHEVELTASLEEKKKLSALLEKIKVEKAKVQNELHATHGEITKLEHEASIIEKEGKVKEEQKEKLTEENKKIREEMQRVSGMLETEMVKAKGSYTKLKDNYEKYSKEKENMLSEQNKKIAILENKNADNGRQLCELQSIIKQKEGKIENLLKEKRTILAEMENKIEELQTELEDKKSLLRKTTTDFESKLEELQMQMQNNEESLKKQIEKNFEEKHVLEKKVTELSHAAVEKDEEIMRQASDADQRIVNAQEEFSKQTKELQNMWEQRLRSHGFADSLSAKSRYIALLNMIKISCELDKLQKQHEENLASTSLELSKSHQSQLDSARSSHQCAIATRDATIAALKDEVDQLRLSHQEAIDAWHHKYENLQSRLADAGHQSECQSERLRVTEANMEESSMQLATSEAGSIGPEERLQQATATRKTLTAQVELLTNVNKQLMTKLEQFEEDKEGTHKTIAMLEFNNEHNKNKVLNMELSNKDLQEKIDKLCKDKEKLVRQIREGSSSLYDDLMQEKEEVENTLTKEKEELERRLTREKGELEQKIAKEKEELELRLTKEKDDLMEKYKAENKTLQEQVEGLMEIRSGYEKQISQIEANNAEMHSKIGGVQQERDAATSEATQLRTQNLNLEKKLNDLSKVKVNLDEQVVALKGTISSLEVKLESEENQVQTLGETINTLQNNILNLQKQVEGLNETCAKLARDLESESKLRVDTQSQLTQVKQMHKQLEETHSADLLTIAKLEKEKEELASSVASLTVARVKALELQARITELESDKRTLSEKLGIIPDTIDSPNDNNVGIVVEQLTERTQTNTDEQRNQDEEVTRLKAVLKTRDEDVSRIRQTLKDVQERLRIAEVISGEVEEQQVKMRELQAKMALAEEQHQQQIKSMLLEAERRVADKEQECQQTISSAYDQQDSETSALVRQHRDVLREAQEEAREKAAALDSVVEDYQTKLKYEEQMASLNAQHEVHIKEVEATWKARAEKMVQHRELQLQEEMDGLTQEWNKERRNPVAESPENPQELERLTQVAAAAFRSGTESVELLKKQVAAQRRELEEVKSNHGKEVGELKALLELKRRTRGSGGGGSGVRLGMPLEEAAEFEYLKNVLYQYMLGKETQTLSKVLCAVVKFDSNQQQEILEHEEQRRSLLETEPSTVHPELLEKERIDPSKAL